MCGIAGEIRFDGALASSEAVRRMTDAEAARGPDGAGVFQQGPVAFGHRRLQIIDLSNRSAQPMVDSELGLSIVYNGAIYNYRELRSDLEARGYQFFSDGDTEVILKAYHAFGDAFAERLSGMFACAIWERDSGRVVLARDHLGIKPLYFSKTAERLRFASTLPALVASGGIDTELDPVALHHYLTFHAVVPAPLTLLSGVRKLPPATVMRIEPDGTTQSHRYWEMKLGPHADDRAVTEEEWQERVLDAVRTAVKRRLVADVPVGVLLSGGLDSSLVVGLIAEAGHSDLATFSIGFESVEGERGDEFQYSRLVAQRFATQHHEIQVEADRMLPNLEPCVRAMSEPMVSHDNIGFFLLSQEVAKHVKVVQSGQGADEVFGGYHWYPPMLTADDAVGAYSKVFFDRTHESLTQLLDPRWVRGDYSRAFVQEHFGTPGAETALEKALRIDTTVMLVDDPVKRVDNMTMASGLEARVPFLDRDLVDLAARVPAALHVKQSGKHVLKEAARKVIPHEVIDRPKGYFPVPALKYLRGPYLRYVRDVISDPRARGRGVFRPEAVEALLVERTKRGQESADLTPLGGSKLWQVALLEMWLQVHGL